jgi:hypothetical protein
MAKMLAERDPAKATEWAKSLPLEFRRGTMLGVLRSVAESSPQKVADYPELLAGAGAERMEIHQLIRQAGKNMADKDLTGAVQWLAEHSTNRELYPATAEVGNQLAEAVRDGRMTAEQAIAAARTTGEQAQELLARLYPELPAAGLARLAGELKSDDGATVALVGAWASKDPEAALRFAGSLEDARLKSLLYENFVGAAASGLSSSIPAQTVAALEKIPEAERAAVLVQHLARYQYGNEEIFGRDLASAAVALPDSEEKTAGLRRIVGMWGANDPPSAMAWAASLPAEDSSRENALGAAVKGWAGADAWGASQWIDAQPPGETRDLASQSLALSLAKVEPASAWDWALSVSDPSRRVEALEPVLESWAEFSPDEARAALEKAATSLPEAEREKLEALLRSPKPAAAKQP